ncbi:hypothetical protein OS493_037749 [Desmophyllum pertusum]|uniref:Uncharacterized protein n=1 Tax=Desmophyllum pertusum TaxID=174260 RepID=A0A9X0CDY8_9CNID|nr:hypothetical protein OS493_037749 [Desmophyllum pertusum]
MRSVMESTIEDLTNYKALEKDIAKELNDKNRFVAINERRDTGVLSADIMASISHGNIYKAEREAELANS